MKSVFLNVCVCSSCVMLGAVDIIHAADHLNVLEHQLGTPISLSLTTSTALDSRFHSTCGPVAILNGVKIQKASGQDVATRILGSITPPADSRKELH